MAIQTNESGSLKTLGGLQVSWDIYRQNTQMTGSKTLVFTTTAGLQWKYQTITFDFSPIFVIIIPIGTTNGGTYANGYFKFTQTNNSYEDTARSDDSTSICGNIFFSGGGMHGTKLTLTGSNLTIGAQSRGNMTSSYDTYLTCQIIAVG